MHIRSAVSAAAIVLALGLCACGDSAGERQEASGEVKETVGTVVGDEDLKREGQADQVVGGVKDAVSDVGDAVKDATN